MNEAVEALLKSVRPLLAPLLMELWTQVVYPELQKLEDQIGSPDLKLVVDTFEKALDTLAKAEIPKI